MTENPQKASDPARPRARKLRVHFILPKNILGIQLLTLTIVALMVGLPLLLTSPTARGEGRLPGNTHIAGMNVSRMTPNDALRAIVPMVERAGENQITVTLLNREHIFSPADIGLVYDPVATVNQVAATRVGGDYDLVVQMDPAQFQRHLDTLRSSLTDPAVNASVTIDGTIATVVPGQDGQVFDAVAYRAAVLESAHADEPHLRFPVATGAPNITTAEAEATAAMVNTMLLEPLVLTVDDLRWEISPAELARAIVVSPNGEGALELGWDIDALQPSLLEVITEIESAERSDAWVQDLGTHSWLVPEQGSMTVDRKQFIENVNATLQGGGRTVEIPVAVNAPDTTSEDVMADLGITRLVASGDSVYTGSGTGRAHNVETAAYYIDRTLVAPGGTFSFNDSVGSLFTAEYMSAGSYIDGPSGQSIAGGVCQVSTTVFRAALNAGFPIEERWPHSYRSPFYELGGWSPGFDAAIVQDLDVPQDSTDMRFTNPTDSWLLITAETNGDRLVVEIWGADTGYEVSYSEPDVWVAYGAPDDVTVMVDDQLPPGTMSRQEPLDGLGVSVSRTVHDRNGEVVLSDTWQTTYYATGLIVRVSPDMEDDALANGG